MLEREKIEKVLHVEAAAAGENKFSIDDVLKSQAWKLQETGEAEGIQKLESWEKRNALTEDHNKVGFSPADAVAAVTRLNTTLRGISNEGASYLNWSTVEEPNTDIIERLAREYMEYYYILNGEEISFEDTIEVFSDNKIN